MNSMNKKILAIIASGVATSALALAAPGGGGAAIGPVSDTPTNTTTQSQKLAPTQFGTMPPNAESSAGGGQTTKMSAGAKTSTSVKTNAKVKSTNKTPR